jgi:PTH1 family peptidyl-tRNA hydrolase
MKSIIGALGTQEILRIRLGLAPERRILKPFTREQLVVVDEVLDRTAEAVKMILTDGVAPAMNRFNRKAEHEGPGSE